MFRMVAPTFVSEECEVYEFHEEHLANDDDDDVDLMTRSRPFSQFREAWIIG